MVEALFTDDDILNRFWFIHDAATEKARLLLRFAFEQVDVHLLFFRHRWDFVTFAFVIRPIGLSFYSDSRWFFSA